MCIGALSFSACTDIRFLAIVCVCLQNASSAEDADRVIGRPPPQPSSLDSRVISIPHSVLCGFEWALWCSTPPTSLPLPLSLFFICFTHTHTHVAYSSLSPHLPASLQPRWSCFSSEQEQWSVMSAGFVGARRAKPALFISLNHVCTHCFIQTQTPSEATVVICNVSVGGVFSFSNWKNCVIVTLQCVTTLFKSLLGHLGFFGLFLCINELRLFFKELCEVKLECVYSIKRTLLLVAMK